MINAPFLWHPAPSRTVNAYVEFRADLRLEVASDVTFKLFGSSLYRFYRNGAELLEGPARFAPEHPEYDVATIGVPAGTSRLTVVVHDYGVHTRILLGGLQPFLQFQATVEGVALPLRWECRELDAFAHLDRRVNGQLGWMESCDTRLLDEATGFWTAPAVLDHPLALTPSRPKSIADCMTLPVKAALIGEGLFTDRFGYPDDDPPIRMISRDLSPALPPDGRWYRYDLGRIALYRPSVTLDLPAGTVVEIGYCESLTEGRVCPVIPLSIGPSCLVDRWIAKGGRQSFQTFAPRGFRFAEIYVYENVSATAMSAVPASERTQLLGLQRTLFAESIGGFSSSDDLLNRIWQTGADTTQSCSEDAIVDSPTRERGQWLGDAALVGMEMMGVSFGGLDLIKRSLQQASYRRNEDGIAAGLCPGQEGYLSSYAMYWIKACLRYCRLTGDSSLLRDCYETASLTADYFAERITPDGAANFGLWDYMDWGSSVPADGVHVAMNVLLYSTLLDYAVWSEEIGETANAARARSSADRLRDLFETRFKTEQGLFVKTIPLTAANAAATGSLQAVIPPGAGSAAHPSADSEPGYHANVLALCFGLHEGESKRLAIELVKSHMLRCYPNDPEAPRLAHPSANSDRLITPNFAHFSLQALWEAGEVDFVLDQYRTCWGWMLDQGATTCLEVFDTRWSHCHAWSCPPTWQLSRYALGLVPDQDHGPDAYRLFFQPGSLALAEGKVPLLGSEGILTVQWKLERPGHWSYAIDSDRPVTLRLQSAEGARLSADSQAAFAGGSLVVNGRQQLTFEFPASEEA